MSVVVEQKKERIRAALQELVHRTCKTSTIEGMETIHRALCHDFGDEDGSTGAFAGDDDFKEEIFSARVIHIIMDASQDKEEYPPKFYHLAWSTLNFLCQNAELPNAFVSNGGVEFLLEYLETFSSDQFLLATCFRVYNDIIESLDTNESVAFAGMTLGKLVDVFQLNIETHDENLYCQYCIAIGSTFGPGCREVSHNLFENIVSHVCHGVIKHKHDEEAHDIGRNLLRHLVGEKAAMNLMRHCENDE
jgi:hypothetical protein